MKTTFFLTHPSIRIALAACAVFSVISLSQAQTTGFNQTAAGPFDYDDTANWVGSNISGVWDSSLTLAAAQSVTFDSNLVLSTGLSFSYTGARELTLRGDGTNRTITLGGYITVAPASNQTVTIGSTTDGQNLNVNLGGNRTFTVSSGKTLRFYNAISGGNLTLSGNNSSTVGGGTMTLSGDAATAPSSAINLTRGAQLSFDGSTSGSAGATRAQSLQLAGGALSITGNAGSSSTETITGALTIAPGHGYNSVTLTPDAGTHLRLNAGSLARSGTGAVLFRGTGLGVNSIASSTAGSSNIAFSTAPTAQLVGGALGTKGAGILPWAVVDTSATGLGSSFATYDATNGIRALNASEYSATIATDGSTDGHNIKLTATGSALTVNGATTVNSLLVDAAATGAHTALDGTGSLTVTSGAVFINIASLTGSNGASLNIGKTLEFGSTQGVIGTSSSSNQRRVTFSGGISGSGGIVFYDTGPNTNLATGFYLNNANTYTGDTYINGTVSVAVNNALANFTNSSRTGDIYLNGVLKLITTGGVVQINGLWGNGTVFSQYSNSNKTLAVGDNNVTSTFDGRVVVDGGTGSINLRKVGTGTLTLTGTDSTYTGTTAVQNGTLSAVTLNNVATPNTGSSLGRPTSLAAGTIGLGLTTATGNLRITGTGETTDRVINLAGTTGGGGIEQTGTGHLKFTSDFTATGGGDKTLTLSGSTAGTGEIAGAIVNNSVANETSLAKSGTGTWTLSGTNTYTGDTTVIAGTLLISDTGSVTSNVTVQGGARIGGAGTIAGNLTLDSGSFLTFSLTDTLHVSTGAVNFGLGGFGVANLSGLTNSVAAGTYQLISGTVNTANLNNVGLANAFELGGGKSAYFQIASLDLVVVPEPATWALLAFSLTTVVVLRRRRA